MAILALPTRRVQVLAVGLDVDGVLRDSAYTAFEAMCKTVEELGGTPPSFSDFVHGYETNYEKYYAARGVKDLEQIYSVYSKHLRPVDVIEPFPDVKQFFAHLEWVELKVFVVSSHATDKLHTWFATHGIDDHPLCIYGGSTDKRACIRNACKEIGVEPLSAMYVGDWGLDMRAATAVGALPIGITRGYASHEGLVRSGATHVVEHLSDLAQMLCV